MIKGMALSNKGSKLSLILAGAFGIAAAVLIVIFLSSAKNDSGGGTSGPTLPAVVASQSIPAGTRITTDMLSLIGKVAALYVQRYDDPVVLSEVDQIEDLTTSLSNKIWQKIMILDRKRAQGPARA